MWSRPDFFKLSVPVSKLTASLKEFRWGAWALMSLYLSLLSGVVVGLQYDYQSPFYSATAIDLLLPYGSFFRSLHFYSSQAVIFLSCFHLLAVYDKTENYTAGQWVRLVATLPVIILLLFTGYILRGDSTGSSAGLIAESIMHTIPVLGATFDNLFFSLTDAGLRKVYVQHVIGLDIVLLLLLWKHLRMYRVAVSDYLPVLAATLLLAMFVAAPIEPDQLGVAYISGPWFFLGLQELLRYLHPLLAGVGFPVLFLLLLFQAYPQYKRSAQCITLLWIWLFCYAILTTIAWVR